MAWNEPGNNNGNNGRDNDPWGSNNRGNGGRDQGPPDLDEVFNKLSQKAGWKVLVEKVAKDLLSVVAVHSVLVSLQ